MEIFTRAFSALVSLDLTMALYRYFKPANDVLPSPMGHLSSSVSPAMIKGHGQQFTLNTKIKTAKISFGGKKGFLRKFGPAKISHYTVHKQAMNQSRWK